MTVLKGGMGGEPGMEPAGGGDLAWQHDQTLEAGYDASMSPDRSKKPPAPKKTNEETVEGAAEIVLKELMSDLQTPNIDDEDEREDIEVVI